MRNIILLSLPVNNIYPIIYNCTFPYILFTVVSLSTALGASVIVIMILLICHKLRMIRLRRLTFFNITADMAPTSTPSSSKSLMRSFSDSALSSPLSNISSIDHEQEACHRYPTRFQMKKMSKT